MLCWVSRSSAPFPEIRADGWPDIREGDGRRQVELVNPWSTAERVSNRRVIGWDNLPSLFEAIHVNWNPARFKHTASVHRRVSVMCIISQRLTRCSLQSARGRCVRSYQRDYSPTLQLVAHELRSHIRGLGSPFTPSPGSQRARRLDWRDNIEIYAR